MKKEMSILRQLAREGTITHHDAGEMVRAIDEAERKSVWEEEGEFDPRRFMAKIYHSYSQTMLNDIIYIERSRCTKQLVDDLRGMTGAEREELLEGVEALTPADPAQFAENSLMVNIGYLRQQKGLDSLSTLAAFKHLEDFSGCDELEQLDLEESKEMLRKSAQQKRAFEGFRTSLPMRRGDMVRLHGPNSVEIYQADGQDLEVIAERVCWADTEEEARKTVENMEIWTFLEGNRVWIRDSRLSEIFGFDHIVNLKLFVPRGTKVSGSISDGVKMKDVEAHVGVSTGNLFSAENVTGNLWVNLRTGRASIVGLNGEVEIETVSGDISVGDSRADLETRSVLGDVTCAHLSGGCKAKLIQGSLIMTDTCTSNLDLSTKGGGITFDGVVMGGMSYDIKSDSGDIDVSLDERSDCGLTAESEKGNITCDLEGRGGVGRSGPNSIYLNVRRGSGGMHVMSKSGNITIKAKKRENT